MSNKEPVREILADDNTGHLFFWIPEGSQEVPCFLMGVDDEGGYSSVLMTKESWEAMKAKVDALIGKHVVVMPKCVMCLKPSVKVCGKGTKPCNYPLCEKCEHPHE